MKHFEPKQILFILVLAAVMTTLIIFRELTAF